MARKSTLTKSGRDFLERLEAVEPVEGCEVEWARYLSAARAHEESYTILNDLSLRVERETLNGTPMKDAKSYPQMAEAEKLYQRTSKAAFGALDAYEYKRKHLHDPPTGPLVPEEDVRALVLASLGDKMNELQWTLKPGLIGSKIAHDILMDVDETDDEPPYCEDCP